MNQKLYIIFFIHAFGQIKTALTGIQQTGFEVRRENKSVANTELSCTCSISSEKAGLLSVSNSILTELRSMPGIFGLVLK